MPLNSVLSGNDRGLITVAVARFSAIGDVAMTVPVLYSACRTYPDVTFVFITRRTMTGIFVNPPANLRVVGVDLKTDYTGPAGLWRLAREIRQDYAIDCFIDLHDVLRTRLLRLFWRLRGIPCAVIRKGRRHKHALTRSRAKRLEPLVSQIDRYKAVFFKAGLPVNDAFGGLFGGRSLSPGSSYAAICPPKADGDKWVGVAPFAAHKGKVYPPSLMLDALRIIAAQCPRVKYFFFGSAAEQPQIEPWLGEFQGSVSLAGKKYGFEAELALINHLDTMITMDSANMHLASIASVPTVSVWGATHPYCGFTGWRQSDADIVQMPMTCRPCSVFGNKPCRRADYMCLHAIKPSDVARKVIDKLNR